MTAKAPTSPPYTHTLWTMIFALLGMGCGQGNDHGMYSPDREISGGTGHSTARISEQGLTNRKSKRRKKLPSPPVSLLGLSDDVIKEMGKYLTQQDIGRMRIVSKQFWAVLWLMPELSIKDLKSFMEGYSTRRSVLFKQVTTLTLGAKDLGDHISSSVFPDNFLEDFLQQECWAKNIKVLNIACYEDVVDVRALIHMGNLETLTIQGSNMTAAVFPPLACLKNLKFFSVRLMDARDLNFLEGATITHFTFCGCGKFDNESSSGLQVLQTLPQLKNLVFKGLCNGFPNGMPVLPQLKSLSFIDDIPTNFCVPSELFIGWDLVDFCALRVLKVINLKGFHLFDALGMVRTALLSHVLQKNPQVRLVIGKVFANQLLLDHPALRCLIIGEEEVATLPDKRGARLLVHGAVYNPHKHTFDEEACDNVVVLEGSLYDTPLTKKPRF